MSNQRRLGVVVVGMGVAGKLRVRDLKVCQQSGSLLRLKLVGYVSRRRLDIENAHPISFEAALSHPDVRMVIITSESKEHEEVARRCILAKKHVCVDFPLTLDATATKKLFSLADANGVVLYEEDVTLHCPPYLELKQNIQGSLSDIKEVELIFAGRFNGWVEDFSKAGSPFTSSMDNIHNLLDLFGNLTPVEAEIQRSEEEIVAQADLLSDTCLIPIRLRIVRKTTIQRRGKVITAKLKDGSCMECVLSAPSKQPRTGVYMADLEMFTQTITGKRDSSHNRWLCIRGLEIADQLNMMAQNNPESNGFHNRENGLIAS